MGIFSRFFHISHSLMMNCLTLFTFSFSTKTQWAPHLSTVILMGSLSSLWRQWKPVGMRDPSPLAAEWKSCNKTTALPRACWDESTALYLEISSLHQKGKSYCWNSRCIPQQHANRQQKSPEAASQLALGTREQSLGWLLLWMGKAVDACEGSPACARKGCKHPRWFQHLSIPVKALHIPTLPSCADSPVPTNDSRVFLGQTNKAISWFGSSGFSRGLRSTAPANPEDCASLLSQSICLNKPCYVCFNAAFFLFAWKPNANEKSL